MEKKKTEIKKENYRFGVLTGSGTGKKAICNCGNLIEVAFSDGISSINCDKCSNDYFIDTRGYRGERFTVPYLESIRRDNRGFKVKRINLSIIRKEDSVTPVKENLTRTMEFDMVDKILKVWREDELEYESGINHGRHFSLEATVNKNFFTLLDQDSFLEFVSTDVTRDLYKIAKSEGRNGNAKRNILAGLYRLMMPKSEWLQILASAGFPNLLRLHMDSKIYRYSSIINYSATKPHEIFGLPKYMMQYMRMDDGLDLKAVSGLQGALKNLNVDKFKDIMSVVQDESNINEFVSAAEDFDVLHRNHGYENLKKLTLYIFREARLNQGIDSPSEVAQYLKDYVNMSKIMNLEWEKYPKSLKKEHDIVMMNYKTISTDERTKKSFALALDNETYKSLAYKNKKDELLIKIPEQAQDIVEEGNQLSHCVASYVKDISNHKCKILFLREKEKPDTPLVTIEVRGYNIRQARGFANRQVTNEQKEFIKKWAEEKNLVEAYY